MPPKKNQANGFYMYMLEQQQKIKAMTKRAPTMREMPGICKQAWDGMSAAERAVYDVQAKQKKRGGGGGGTDYRMDNQRQLISERVDSTKEFEKRRLLESNKMRANWKGQDLLSLPFHVIDFQVMYNEWREDHRLPMEIGLVRFTLRDGITKHYHEFINPGDAPQGNRHLALSHSESTHQIPLNFEQGTTNFQSLWMKIERFICEDPLSDDMPPLFCLSENVLDVESCLEYIYDRAGTEEPNRLFKVYCLEDMVASLVIVSGVMEREPSKTQLLDMLRQNRWDYTNSIRCFYHQEVDCAYCSLSIVRRQSFSIFDTLSKSLGFELTDKHMPDETNAVFSVVHPSSFKTSKDKTADSWQPYDRRPGNRSAASSVRSPSPPPLRTTKVEIPSTKPQGRFTIELSDESNSDDDDEVEEEEEDDDDEVRSTSDQYELKQLRLPKTLSSAAACAGRGRGEGDSAEVMPAQPVPAPLQATNIVRGRGRFPGPQTVAQSNPDIPLGGLRLSGPRASVPPQAARPQGVVRPLSLAGAQQPSSQGAVRPPPGFEPLNTSPAVPGGGRGLMPAGVGRGLLGRDFASLTPGHPFVAPARPAAPEGQPSAWGVTPSSAISAAPPGLAARQAAPSAWGAVSSVSTTAGPLGVAGSARPAVPGGQPSAWGAVSTVPTPAAPQGMTRGRGSAIGRGSYASQLEK